MRYFIRAATNTTQYERLSIVADGWTVSDHGVVTFYIIVDGIQQRLLAYRLDTSEYVTI